MIKDINLVKAFLVNSLNVLSVSRIDVWVSHFCNIQSVLLVLIKNIWDSV